VTHRLTAASLALFLLSAQAQPAPSQQQTGQQQAIPDAPRPQALPDLGAVAPGKGTTPTSAGDIPDQAVAPTATLPSSPTAAQGVTTADSIEDQTKPELTGTTIVVQANFVEVPFTVKDSKGKLVPGLTYHDVRIFENGALQHMSRFTVDPYPLSVALVIDQSMGVADMKRVNIALGALQGAFTSYDQVAIFTYNNGPKKVTDYTAAQGARLTQALEAAKSSGREALMAGSLSGPLAQTTVINDQNVDPNTAPQRGHTGMALDVPREVHTLNDAILAAAISLSKTPTDRRRVIYVISDGKEYGSAAKYKDVVKYLQTNKIGVYGTLVGDSAITFAGFLDRISLPLMMKDNILPAYAAATGGNFDAEFRTGEIEKSFARIAEEVRTQYTIGYYSHESSLDDKFRKIEVRVLRPNLTVLAKAGYYPAASDFRPRQFLAAPKTAPPTPKPAPVPTLK
jgi:VWFA-related protein